MTRETFSIPLDTMEAAKAFVEFLHAEGLMFHFDDDVQDVEWGDPDNAPSLDELTQLDLRIDELYTFEWGTFECPIGYALHVMDQSSS